jgi:hypothetical protein
MMKKLARISSFLVCTLMVAVVGMAGSPEGRLDLLQNETINGNEVQYVVEQDGQMMVYVTNQSGETHLHAIPLYGFWGYVTNDGSPADANVAVNLVWSDGIRTTEDAHTCTECGFWSKACTAESGFTLMASLNTTGGHEPLVHDGYRCADDNIRYDFAMDVQFFYMKLCNSTPSGS